MSDNSDFIDGFWPYRTETVNYQSIPDIPADHPKIQKKNHTMII